MVDSFKRKNERLTIYECEDTTGILNIRFGDNKKIISIKLYARLNRYDSNNSINSINSKIPICMEDPIYNSIRKISLKFNSIKTLYVLQLFLENPDIRKNSYEELLLNSESKIYKNILTKELWDYIKNDEFLKDFIIN